MSLVLNSDFIILYSRVCQESELFGCENNLPTMKQDDIIRRKNIFCALAKSNIDSPKYD